MHATPPPTAAATVVLTTVGSEDAAERLVRALLDERVIACGTALPGARSLYRWQGAIADDREVVLLLKTVPGRLPDLVRAFTRHHPYEVPELLALPVADGAAPYLAWLAAAVAPSSAPTPDPTP